MKIIITILFVFFSFQFVLSQHIDTLVLKDKGIDNIILLKSSRKEVRKYKRLTYVKIRGEVEHLFASPENDIGQQQYLTFKNDSIRFVFRSKCRKCLYWIPLFIGKRLPLKKKLTSIELKGHWLIKYQNEIVQIKKSNRFDCKKIHDLKESHDNGGLQIIFNYDSNDILYQISLEESNY